MAMFQRSGKPQQTPSSGTESTEPKPQAQPAARESRQQPASGRNAAPSVISSALTITGDLESAGDIQIDGAIEGDVRAQTVKIGDGANVRGSVLGNTVELAGSVEGKIEADNVSITRTGRMNGDIAHKTLQVESGAFIDGHVRSQSGSAARQAGASAGQQSGQGTSARSASAASADASASSPSSSSSSAKTGEGEKSEAGKAAG